MTDLERFLFDVAGFLVIPQALSPAEVEACLEKRLNACTLPILRESGAR